MDALFKKWGMIWIFAGLTPALFILGFLTFICSIEIATRIGEPDGTIAILGFVAAVVLVILSAVCGMCTVVLWWNRREFDDGLTYNNKK